MAALLVGATVANAQTRSAIGAAKNTAAVAEARNASIEQQQKAAMAEQPDSNRQQVAGVDASSASPQRAVPTITREVFQYDGGGRRDPFLSLVKTGALRPNITELALVIVMVGANGSGGVATIVDNTTKERYLVRIGDLLGRYRVVGIDKKSVTFAIEEFGFSRQEKLVLLDTSKERNQ
jgi:hypothetical protein